MAAAAPFPAVASSSQFKLVLGERERDLLTNKKARLLLSCLVAPPLLEGNTHFRRRASRRDVKLQRKQSMGGGKPLLLLE